MRASGLPLYALSKSAFLKHLQHRTICRQHVRSEFAQFCLAGNQSEVPHQSCANTLALISVDNHESELAYSGRRDDVASTANNDRMAVIFRNRHQGDVIDKIDIHEKAYFVLGKVAFRSEEPPVKRLWTGAADGRHVLGSILGPKRANFDAVPISQRLDSGIF
jgi:hypothetical protein